MFEPVRQDTSNRSPILEFEVLDNVLDLLQEGVLPLRPLANVRRSPAILRGVPEIAPLRAPNKKRVWGAVVVDGVYGETTGQ
jgi:hypothetical protein